MGAKVWFVLFGKYVGAGVVAYPLELAGIYAITTYLHIWYLLSAAISLALAFFLYFAMDVAFGVVKPPNEFRQPNREEPPNAD